MIDFHIVPRVYHDPVSAGKQQRVADTLDNTGMETTLADRLRQARQNAELSQTGLAKRVGCSQALIGNLEAGSQKSTTYLPQIAEVLGVSGFWLQTGRGLMLADEAHQARATATAASMAGVIGGAVGAAYVAASATPNPVPFDTHPDLVQVPRVQFKLSAGVSGFAIEPESGNGKPIYFREDWFRLHNYRPEKLFSVRVSGASMEPSLWDGDLVVVNTDDTKLHDGDVYALNYEGEMVIKRMRRDAGEWWATSDNADQRRFAPKRCTEDVQVIGRVVYKQSERI